MFKKDELYFNNMLWVGVKPTRIISFRKQQTFRIINVRKIYSFNILSYKNVVTLLFHEDAGNWALCRPDIDNPLPHHNPPPPQPLENTKHSSHPCLCSVLFYGSTPDPQLITHTCAALQKCNTSLLPLSNTSCFLPHCVPVFSLLEFRSRTLWKCIQYSLKHFAFLQL